MPELKGKVSIEVGQDGQRVVLDVKGVTGHRMVSRLTEQEVIGLVKGIIEAASRVGYYAGPAPDMAANMTRDLIKARLPGSSW